MTIDELLNKYRIRIQGENLACERKIANNPDDVAFLKANKPAIIAEIQRREAEKAEREAKIKAERKEWEHSIGLDVLKNAIKEWNSYKAEFDRAWELGDGVYPASPNVKVEDIRAQYPIAAAYLKAEAWSESPHYVKASAGKKAMTAIRSGKDHKEAISQMEKEFHAYCEEHIFD